MSHSYSNQLRRIKYVAWIEMGESPPSDKYSLSADAGLPFLQGTADFGAKYPLPQVYCAVPRKVALADDILFSVCDRVGELNIADREYGIGRGLCAIRCHEQLDKRFAWWSLHWSREQLAYKVKGNTDETVASVDIANLLIPLPTLDKQRAIADYLDGETAKIDALIAAKERLLEFLSEKRCALITHAVTYGLNPNTPMRDLSRVWFKKVPKHWKVARLKTVCHLFQAEPFRAQLPAKNYVDSAIPVINPAHLANGKIALEQQVSVDRETAERLAVYKLEAGDVIFARRGKTGQYGLVTQQEVGWLYGSGGLRVRPKKEMLDSKYLVLLMSDTFAGSYLSLVSVGTTTHNLNTETIGKLVIPLPPLSEQQAIVSYIESEISKLDALKAAAESTIKFLHERRLALIATVVTGQINVIM